MASSVAERPAGPIDHTAPAAARGVRQWLGAALVAAAFGPYVVSIGAGGVRAEQALLYPLGAAALAIRGRDALRRVRRERPPIAVAAALVALTAAWTLFSTITLAPPAPRSFLGALGSFESMIQSAAVLFVLWAWVDLGARSDPTLALQRSCRALLALLAANALLALVSSYVNLRPLEVHFWGTPMESGMTVADLAALNCRFSGVFNQPLEAGTACSVALFGWVYLDRVRRGSGFANYVCLLLLVTGGLVSISKVFLIGGLWIGIAAWLATRGWSRLRVRPLLGACVVAGIPVALALRTWCGWGPALALLPTEVLKGTGLSWALAFKNVAYSYSGGRIGAGRSMLIEQFLEVLRRAPLQGFGFGSSTIFDSGYAEFLYQGGLVGLALYLLFLGYVAVWGNRLRRRGRPEGLLVLSIVGLIAFAGLGGPMITLNRDTVFIGVLTGLGLLAAEPAPATLHEVGAVRT